MRVSILIPIMATLAAAPAPAQVSARVQVGIPIGRPLVGPRRQVIVRAYDPYLFGAWDTYYDAWQPATLYYYDGYYYDYPIVEYAEPVVVFSYHNQFFFPPRDRAFEVWRREFRPDRDFRAVPRFSQGPRFVGRDSRGVVVGRENVRPRPMPVAPREGRIEAAPRGGRDVRPAPAPRSGSMRGGGGQARGRGRP